MLLKIPVACSCICDFNLLSEKSSHWHLALNRLSGFGFIFVLKLPVMINLPKICFIVSLGLWCNMVYGLTYFIAGVSQWCHRLTPYVYIARSQRPLHRIPKQQFNADITYTSFHWYHSLPLNPLHRPPWHTSFLKGIQNEVRYIQWVFHQ